MELANKPDSAATQPAAPSSSSEVDLTGQVLGDFRILHRLGKGGMGEVYLAEQLKLQRKVALKLLHPDMANNERALKRFKAEAKNVARASHANIVQIIDIYETNGLNYIALEYVEGKNLREFIERKGTPEISLGLHIMAQAASALQRAGELGVVHRDVKPENIMLTKKGEVKVADFGLSRCFEEGYAQNLTQSQVVMGTPLYMSPEQVEHKPVDGRTDIYSLGVTCYYMFAGQPPFRGNSPVDVAYQHVHAEPPPLAEVRPDLPADLCAMIHKMMAKKPDDRYQSAREIVRDISRLRDALNLSAIAAISMSASFVADAVRESGAKTGPVQPSRLLRWRRVTLAACMLVALAGGLALGVFQHRQSQKDHPSTDDPAPVKALFDAQEQESELKKLVMERLDNDGRPGLDLAIDLTLKYLKRRKYDAADELFKVLLKTDEKLSYRKLGRLGHAMVLAFKDQPRESNREFVEILTEFKRFEDRVGPGSFFKAGPIAKKTVGLEDEIEKHKLLWKFNPQMRELVARALDHNFANAPVEFPADKLDVYRSPPRPVLRAP